MQLTDFHFDLPAERIARHPLPSRSESRLLAVQSESLHHYHFSDILQLVEPGDLLVFNDTKVIPARLIGHKSTGGQVQVLVERLLDDKRVRAQIRASKPPRVGDALHFPAEIALHIEKRTDLFYELCYVQNDKSILQVIETIGQIPLPPYLHRLPDENDTERYQTVYARHKGSVAAPTAGLHFDETLLQTLRDKGVLFAYLTLHIGAGTFAPVRDLDISKHVMHAEYIDVSAQLCETIHATKARGHRVIAVGTTSLRALETASRSGCLAPFQGETNIFITPGHRFHSADILITNMHLPRSTLLMLVCAFGGYATVMQAYQEAIHTGYRFYSYGDAMWVAHEK